MKKYYVYLAGPLKTGDIQLNVRRAIQEADALLQAGFIPFVPHMDFIWGLLAYKTADEWLEYDYQWILKCNALLALPGDSKGKDKEIAFANAHNIPVFHCMVGLIKWRYEKERDNKRLVDQYENLVGCELCGVIGCRGGCNKD